MFERLKSEACSVALAALLLGPWSVTAAGAVTPSTGADLTDIQSVFDTMNLSSKRYVVVGCDGTSPSRVGRIQMIDVKTGSVVWQASLTPPDSCLLSVVATPDRVYAFGNTKNPAHPRGSNLLVQARDAKDGTLLWEQEIEGPNPNHAMSRPLLNHPNLVVLGSKLMILAAEAGVADSALLFRLDADTGALLPATP